MDGEKSAEAAYYNVSSSLPMEYLSGFLHKSMAHALPVAGLVLSLGIAVPLAQSPALGEVARKESERRKTQAPAAKVYTNKDLPASAKGRPSVPPAGETAPASPAGTEQKPEADGRPVEAAKPEEETKPGKAARDEAWWRARMLEAREELRRNELFAEALQSRINALSREFVNRDAPPQRRALAEDRTEALNELSRVHAEIERGKKAIADIQEEARQAGVPAGWLH